MVFSPDGDLRSRERMQELVSVDRQAAFMAELMRYARLSIQQVFLAAVYGHEASQRLVEVPERLRLETVQSEDLLQVLPWFFGDRLIPKKVLEFLTTLGPRYEHVLSTMIQFLGVLQPADRCVPDRRRVFPALMAHLVRFPELLETIASMEDPVLQLLPVFNDPDVGFLRLINPVDHRCSRWGPTLIDVDSRLRDAWGRMNINQAHIVGWRLAITEGAFQLSSDADFSASRTLEEHWQQWIQGRESVEYSGPLSYLLLQLPRLLQFPRPELLDGDRVVVLGRSESAGGLCVLAYFNSEGLLTFFPESSQAVVEDIRIRASVSFELPLS